MTRTRLPKLMSWLVLLGLPVLAAGCADFDPYRREGMWQPQGVAGGNLAAMVADPMDLMRGQQSDGSDDGRAAAAIAKWVKAGPGAPSTLATDNTTGSH